VVALLYEAEDLGQLLVPSLNAAAPAATGPSVQTFAIAERLPLAVAPAVGVTLQVIAVILAVYKPPWRLRVRPAQGKHPS
jgi:hypothetical protein